MPPGDITWKNLQFTLCHVEGCNHHQPDFPELTQMTSLELLMVKMSPGGFFQLTAENILNQASQKEV